YKTFLATTGAAHPPVKEKREMTTDTGADDRRGSPGGCPPAAACCETATATLPVKVVDATGLQCPGPIMRLKAELAELRAGQALAIDVSDPAFGNDVSAWCHSTGHELLGIQRWNGTVRATVLKREARLAEVSGPASVTKGKTIVVFSDDFDRAMAAFIIANGAAAMGSKPTLFFTFWGLNVLRRPEAVKVKKTVVERMFGWMMPRGAGKLKLSKMHMGGMGTAMMQGIMKRKNVASLPELIESAKKAGVRLVACSMSMDLMGIKKEELIEGVEEGGVAMYLDQAEAGNVNLFI
ncbi:MAG: DsrE/DsrF/DrsH-like family protein, partial [Planctomycetota bacterium]|nr:DsrE/DsrF/DrsH-like family protein [Planctomycetota bacterium]